MKFLGIPLAALLLGGCVVVPARPYAYHPAPSPRVTYAYPAYPHYHYWHPYDGKRYHYRHQGP